MPRSRISSFGQPPSCIAICTFSYAESGSNRLCIWKMKPMLRRISNSADSGMPASPWPRISIVPSWSERKAPTKVNSVVFPEPEGPVMITS